MYMQIHDTHMYTHIITKYRARNIFMTKSFLFNIQNKSFHDRVISLLQHRKVLQRTFYFHFLLTNSETYKPIRQYNRHRYVPPVMGVGVALWVACRVILG